MSSEYRATKDNLVVVMYRSDVWSDNRPEVNICNGSEDITIPLSQLDDLTELLKSVSKARTNLPLFKKGAE